MTDSTRRPTRIGRQGLAHHRWIVGVKRCLWLDPWGEVVGWAGASAHARDRGFHPLIERVQARRVILADTGFHARTGDPPNRKRCPRGT